MNIVLLIIGLVLILGTGFFVAVEFSLVALESSAVQAARAAGDRKADAVLKCLKTLSTQLSSCQVGITITTLLTGYTLDASINSLASGGACAHPCSCDGYRHPAIIAFGGARA